MNLFSSSKHWLRAFVILEGSQVVIIYLFFFFLCIIKYVLFFKNWCEKLLFPQEGENQATIIWLQGQEHLPHVQITVTGGDETFGRMNIDSDNILRPAYNEKGGERTGEGGLLQSVLQLHERIFELRWETLPLGGIHMEDLQWRQYL